MIKKKLSVYIIAIFIMLLTACSKTIPERDSMNGNGLRTWIGEYSFDEFIPPNINMVYNINIYEENNSYLANIDIDGFQTITRIKANVLGNQRSINIVFQEYLPDNRFESYSKGDVLLNFKKVNSKIYTDWGGIQPISPENQANNKIYFKLKKN